MKLTIIYITPIATMGGSSLVDINVFVIIVLATHTIAGIE